MKSECKEIGDNSRGADNRQFQFFSEKQRSRWPFQSAFSR